MHCTLDTRQEGFKMLKVILINSPRNYAKCSGIQKSNLAEAITGLNRDGEVLKTISKLCTRQRQAISHKSHY